MAKNKNLEQKPKAPQQGKDEYTIKDYLYINLFFWLLLGAVALILLLTTGWKFDPVMQSVFAFIFLVFGGGFTLVSIFDFIYDRAAGKGTNEEKQ
jgi:hypothetical protein